MIKSVVQPIPTYVMSYFLLLKQLCHKLTSAVANFGGVQKQTRKICIGCLGKNYASQKRMEELVSSLSKSSTQPLWLSNSGD